MPDTTQDAGKAVLVRVRANAKSGYVCGMRLEELNALLAYITALEERNRTLEEIRDFHKGEIDIRNGSAE